MRQSVVAIVLSLIPLPLLWGAQQGTPLPNAGPVLEVQQGTGYLGVGLLDIDEQRAHELHLSEVRGAEVSRVDEGSPADKAGVHSGDVLLEFNGQPLEGTSQLGRLVQETPPGHKAKLKIWRDGKTAVLVVTIEARKAKLTIPTIAEPNLTFQPQMWDMPNPMLAWRSGMIGIECESLSPQLAEYFSVKYGVLVRTVLKNLPAEHAGLKAGDVITRVGDKPVTSPSELTVCLRMRNTKTVTLGVTRDHKEISISVTTDDPQTSAQQGIKSVGPQ